MHQFNFIVASLLLLWGASCSHNDANEALPQGEDVTISEDRDEVDAPAGALILRKGDPNAVKILRESCPGGYDPVDDFSNPPSTEIGISHEFSGDTGPYVRYRCRGM